MAEIVTLADGVRELVHDGDTVALEGFTHLIPHAAGHELIRQERRELTRAGTALNDDVLRATPDHRYRPVLKSRASRWRRPRRSGRPPAKL